MAILEEVKKIAKQYDVDVAGKDITMLLNEIAAAKGGSGVGRNVGEAMAALSDALSFTEVTVAAEEAATTVFGHTVSDLQTDLTVTGNAITGTLAYVDEGALPTAWGEGNFMVLKFTLPETVTSCLVGMNPSKGSGLVELVGDPDMNGAFKVSNKDTQKFTMVITNDGVVARKEFDLSGLTLVEADSGNA